MNIDLFPAPGAGKRELSGKNAVVIDAFRATSTIITAISNGCPGVIPVAEISEAADVAARLGRGNALMCGERRGLPIDGFDLSNSPLEFTAQRVAGHTLIMTTTNGTSAINSCKDAQCVLIGAFLNASSVAKLLCALEGDCVIVCAGTGGRFSTDDILAAGAVIERLSKMTNLIMCDLALTAQRLYKSAASDLHRALAGTRSYEYLKGLGFGADIDFCLRTDVMDCVPMLYEGVVRKAAFGA